MAAKQVFIKNVIRIFLCTIIFNSIAPHASAEEKNMITDILPQMTINKDKGTNHTHPAIKLTLDKSELIRFDQEIGSIIIGNPSHINAIADSATILIIVPRSPGATHFTVLGKKGETLMQRHVIVAGPKKDYVRVRRTCTNAGDACEEDSIFYCPDTCHEISIDTSNIEN